MQSSHPPPQNHLLAALQADEYARLAPHLELVSLPPGCVLYETGARIHHAYFPTTAIVPLLYDMENGASAEIAVVGNEGMVGVPLFMGGETSPSRAIVQGGGHAYRLNGQLLKNEFIRGGRMQGLLLRYTQALLVQMAQTAACNRHHLVDQQLCRWLLLNLDRQPSNVLVMTHELIGNMLGVRREGISEAAGKLQHAGLIHYSRGRITVVDRPGLEARVCECYHVVKKEFARLLPKMIVRETGCLDAVAAPYSAAKSDSVPGVAAVRSGVQGGGACPAQKAMILTSRRSSARLAALTPP